MNDPAPIRTQAVGAPPSLRPAGDSPIPQAGGAPAVPFVVPEPVRAVERVPDLPTTVEVTTSDPAPPQSSPVTRPQTVREAIADAARRSSVDYNYLIAQAELESGLDPHAKASTSTATGLFQFLETTWLSTVKRHGPRFGLGEVADQIQVFSNGRPYVPDRGQRNAILALRNDPQIAALMAAGFAEDNRAALEPVLGRQPGHSELYLAHFLGAGGARKFLIELQRNQGQSAAAVFPEAAAANRPIFYTQDGSTRSLAGVMQLIEGKMARALARVGGEGSATRADAPFAPMTLTRVTAAPSQISDVRTRIASADFPAPADGVMRGYSALPASRTPGIGPARSALSMSSMLRATFGGDGTPALASPQGAAQVRRAYDQLKAFGL